MLLWRSVVITLFLLSINEVRTQENVLLQEEQYFIPQVEERTNDGLYGIGLHQAESDKVDARSVAYQASNALAIDETRSIDLLLESISRNGDGQLRTKNLILVANEYFRKKDYNKAYSYYNQIDQQLLYGESLQEVCFKSGYCLLSKKNFDRSLDQFREATDIGGPYTTDATYYKAICHYYLNDQEAAIKGFTQVENNAEYKDLIPYYIAQIYFKDQDYQGVIDYMQSKINRQSMYNRSLIDRIIGLSYLAQDKPQQAITHLEAYATSTESITENELFQIASTHYKLRNYDEAIPHLVELSPQNTIIGQKSNYLLASIYLTKDHKKKAKSAFKKASDFHTKNEVALESEFNYYKLSAELGEQRVAINGLSQISSDNPYHQESQRILSHLFRNAQDLDAAIKAIENLSSKTPDVLSAYKEINYNKGVQLLSENKAQSSISYLKNSLNTPGDKHLDDECNYMIGLAYDKLDNKEQSSEYLQKYLKGDHKAHKFESNYMLGYNSISNNNYKEAQAYLLAGVDSYDPYKDDLGVLNDALVRLADIDLLQNNYEDAISFYDMAIANKSTESDYIHLQKAQIYDVQGKLYDRLTTLEDLIKNHPESEYEDDAVYEIGQALMDQQKQNEAYKVFYSIPQKYGEKSQYAQQSYLNMGLISYNSGDYQKAISHYNKVIQISNSKEDQRQALLAIEEIYLNGMNDPDGYFRYADKSNSLDLNRYDKDSITYMVAYSAYKKSQYEKAISLFSDYEKQFSDGYKLNDAQYYSGECYSLIKRYSSALSQYEKLLSDAAGKHYHNALKKSALIAYNHSQDFDKAHTYYSKLIELNNADTNLEYVQSAFYSAIKINNEESILDHGRRLIKIEELSTTDKGTAHYHLAKAYHRRNDLDNAMVSYSKVITSVDNHYASESGYLLSKLYYDKGEYDKAETQAYTTTQNSAHYPLWTCKSLILIGDILDYKSDYLNATAAYETVIENFPEQKESVAEAQQKLDTLNEKIKEESRIESEQEVIIPNQEEKTR